MSDFILSCESTADLPYYYCEKRDISVLFYNYSVNGQSYEDNMGRSEQANARFYKLIDEGNIPTTSQINTYTYVEYFEKLLQKGDVLHVVLGTGMTGSYNCAKEAAAQVLPKFPNRKLCVVDSICSSIGFGLLVDMVADLKESGADIDECCKWLEENKSNIHHRFFSTTLKYFKRTGRVKSATALISGVLGICPLMRLDERGFIVTNGIARGKKRAVRATVDFMEKYAENGLDYAKKVYIGHSDCLEDALATKKEVLSRFKNLSDKDIVVNDIGNIIASHCGPGTVALFYYGVKRNDEKKI